MNKFIELKNLNGEIISLNVNYIFEIMEGTQHKDIDGTTILLAVTGFNGFAYQYVETRLPYEYVMNLIKS